MAPAIEHLCLKETHLTFTLSRNPRYLVIMKPLSLYNGNVESGTCYNLHVGNILVQE